MRAIVQRVSSASVTVDSSVVASISRGLLVLVGVAEGDTGQDAEALASKIAAMRVFPDEEGRMNLSVDDVAGEVLVVSQFTLLADVRRGRRPSFARAADPELARDLINQVSEFLIQGGIPVVEGRFGAKMSVALVNEGPVTIPIDTSNGKVL